MNLIAHNSKLNPICWQASGIVPKKHKLSSTNSTKPSMPLPISPILQGIDRKLACKIKLKLNRDDCLPGICGVYCWSRIRLCQLYKLRSLSFLPCQGNSVCSSPNARSTLSEWVVNCYFPNRNKCIFLLNGKMYCSFPNGERKFRLIMVTKNHKNDKISLWN